MAPQRIQRKRTAGWRMPDGAVYVGRRGRWGNPYKVGTMLTVSGLATGERVRDRAHAVELYEQLLGVSPQMQANARRELAGKNLVCWCPLDQPCHADVLLRIANKAVA